MSRCASSRCDSASDVATARISFEYYRRTVPLIHVLVFSGREGRWDGSLGLCCL